MYQVLEESRGEELLTLYREVFLVKTSASRVSKPVLKVKGVDSGQKWSELLAKYDLDMCLWKTSQRSLLEDLESSLEIFPKCGMTRNGRAYQRPKLGQITDESVFGFYVPTPTASDGTSGAVIGKNDTYYTTSTGMPRKMTRHGVDGSVGLGRLVNMWPTPSANEDAAGTPNGNMQRMLGNCKEVRGETKKEWEKGSLNADWTEWLMGFPVGWSDLEALPGEALPWDKEPEGIPRVVKKQNHRALRLRGIGNAQVPQCAAEAYLSLLERFNE